MIRTVRPALSAEAGDHAFLRRLLLIILLLLLLFLFLVVPSASIAAPQGNTFDSAARQFAAKIVRSLGKQEEAVSVRFQNRSSVSDADFLAIKRTIEEAMVNAGASPTDGIGVSGAIITLSENSTKLVWVAELSSNDKNEIVVFELPRPATARETAPAGVTLRQELFWEQTEPLLDVVEVKLPGSEKSALSLLSTRSIELVQSVGGRWESFRKIPLPRERSDARTLRGFAYSHAEGLTIYYPTEGCEWRFEKPDEPRCGGNVGKPASDERGIIVNGIVLGHSRTDHRIINVYENGEAALLDNPGKKLFATFTGWGTELASLEIVCSPGEYALVSRPTDWTEKDAVQVYKILERGAVAVSAPHELPGPALALRGASDQSAWIVVRNLMTGKYEAYNLTVMCGR